MSEFLLNLATKWIGYKIWLVDNIGLTNDAMHVHGGLALLCVSAILIRRRPDSIWCWLIVLTAEIFNEYADVKGLAPGEDDLNSGLHDIYNTMFWPTVILILGRFLFPPRIKQAKNENSETADLSDLPDQSFEQPPPV
jgi:hypothetical protein